MHVPVSVVGGAVGWIRSQADVRRRERTVALREQAVTARTERLTALETAERNIANRRWSGLELELPQIVRGYWDSSGRVDLTLNYRIRNRRAIGGFVETVQGSVTWLGGVVTPLESKRVDHQLAAGTAHDFSRPVQWMVREDQLEWLTRASKRIALVSCMVTLEIFVRLGDEVVRIDLTNQSVELLVSA